MHASHVFQIKQHSFSRLTFNLDESAEQSTSPSPIALQRFRKGVAKGLGYSNWEAKHFRSTCKDGSGIKRGDKAVGLIQRRFKCPQHWGWKVKEGKGCFGGRDEENQHQFGKRAEEVSN